MSKQRLCRICKQRPPWTHRNCPPGVCKRCYHAHVWTERPAARTGRGASRDEVETQPMVYDGYHGGFVPVEAASFDVATTLGAVVQLAAEVIEQ